jgi:hypothetical protein
MATQAWPWSADFGVTGRPEDNERRRGRRALRASNRQAANFVLRVVAENENVKLKCKMTEAFSSF